MAKLEKKPKDSHDNDWLATYSDMVTLLLTFFVMLYASSSLDEQKWQYIYQAFQSRGKYLNEYIDHPNHTQDEGSYVQSEDPSQAGGEGTQPQSFDKLYQYLSEYIDDNQLSDAMSVSKDAAHIFIRFNSNVFFGGNSSELTQTGKDIIDDISPALTALKKSIQRVTVSGHTAQGVSAVNDWDLSGGRAASVVKYMEFKKTLDSEQFRTQGVGPHEPVADNGTEEGRSQNRRVELVILRNDLDYTDPEVIKDILAQDYNLPIDQIDPNAPSQDQGKLPNDSAQGIIDSLESLFPSGGQSGFTGSVSGPVIYDEFESFIKAEEAEAVDAEAADADAAADDAAAE
ncbi:MAG: flagellar motor protein MotB [Oscillospiraceae bacterium]|nr:flagellar motor protein MotB [Oscillospiraceae bacterium]